MRQGKVAKYWPRKKLKTQIPLVCHQLKHLKLLKLRLKSVSRPSDLNVYGGDISVQYSLSWTRNADPATPLRRVVLDQKDIE